MAGGGKSVSPARSRCAYGEGSVWTQNDENKGLRFIVNGYHAKFQDIVINGAVADKKHY